MFVREKHINGYTYLYLVESVREDGRAKQRIIKNLGRKDAVIASGELERLAASIGRYAERAIVFSQLQAGDLDGLSCKRIGAPLLFGRLWQDTGCRAVIDELLAARGFEYPLERAVFVSVLHRIMVSGSDRACEKWMTDYDIPKIDQLALHNFYRAMAWLGEELDADQQAMLQGPQVLDGLVARSAPLRTGIPARKHSADGDRRLTPILRQSRWNC